MFLAKGIRLFLARGIVPSRADRARHAGASGDNADLPGPLSEHACADRLSRRRMLRRRELCHGDGAGGGRMKPLFFANNFEYAGMMEG